MAGSAIQNVAAIPPQANAVVSSSTRLRGVAVLVAQQHQPGHEVEPEQQDPAGQGRGVEAAVAAEVAQHPERATADADEVHPERQVVRLEEAERQAPARLLDGGELGRLGLGLGRHRLAPGVMLRRTPSISPRNRSNWPGAVRTRNSSAGAPSSRLAAAGHLEGDVEPVTAGRRRALRDAGEPGGGRHRAPRAVDRGSVVALRTPHLVEEGFRGAAVGGAAQGDRRAAGGQDDLQARRVRDGGAGQRAALQLPAHAAGRRSRRRRGRAGHRPGSRCARGSRR